MTYVKRLLELAERNYRADRRAERNRRIVQLYRAGLSLRAVAAELGCSHELVRYVIKLRSPASLHDRSWRTPQPQQAAA